MICPFQSGIPGQKGSAFDLALQRSQAGVIIPLLDGDPPDDQGETARGFFIGDLSGKQVIKAGELFFQTEQFLQNGRRGSAGSFFGKRKDRIEIVIAAAEAAVKIIPLAKVAVEKGNSNAVTDALVGCMMARTAVLGTALNCRINLASIKDEAFTAELAKKVDGLIAQAIAGEKEVFAATELTSDF